MRDRTGITGAHGVHDSYGPPARSLEPPVPDSPASCLFLAPTTHQPKGAPLSHPSGVREARSCHLAKHARAIPSHASLQFPKMLMPPE